MTTVRSYQALIAVGLLSMSCSSATTSNGGGNGGAAVAGIALPQEVSALPTKSAGTSSPTVVSAFAISQALSTDYDDAKTFKYVDERALSQFSILNTIFKAIGQTHYADPANVNQGPYGAMIAWEEDHGDSQAKNMVPWVVQSDMVDSGGSQVNELRVWMLMPMGESGQVVLIKVKMTIAQAPTQNPDGSYSDYGVWRLDARADAVGGNFSAEASHDAAGLSVIGIHDGMDHDGGEETLGVLHKSASEGYGAVRFPNWNDPSCMNGGCNAPPLLTVAYQYDADTVALKKGSADTVYKDRSQVVDVVQRYGLFDSDGADVTKLHHFGFPLQYADQSGNHYAYYGAWQGRHQVWGNGSSVPPGTTVTRETYGSGPGESYTTSAVFTGILVKRTLVPAAIADIQDVVVGTWIGEGMSITYSSAGGGSWTSCLNPHSDGYQQVCDSSGPFDPANLAADPALDQNVWINRCDMSGCFNLVYVSGTFYRATMSPGQPPQPDMQQPWSPMDGDNLWVNINKPIFFYWNGTQWMQKKLIGFDSYHNALFDPDPSTESPFALSPNQDYYLNDMGTNYVVRFDGSSYTVKVEQQSVAHPGDPASFPADGTIFKRAWGGDSQSRFTFNTSTLKLVYDTVGPQDQTAGHLQGDVLDSSEWSLVASADGFVTSEMYNWEYPNANPKPGDNYGTQQFLMAGLNYVILDNPIRLASVALASEVGAVSKKYSLQFDGSWVSGLPQIWSDLQDAGYDMNATIAAKVVNIPNGQVVTDAADGSKTYRFKQLQVTEYLLPANPKPSLDLSLASGVAANLDSLAPAFVDPGLGAMPQVPVKYSEGELVQ